MKARCPQSVQILYHGRNFLIVIIIFFCYLKCSYNLISCHRLCDNFVLCRWGHDKFPEENPLVFFREGKPIVPPLGILEGLQVVLESMVSHIEKEVPKKTLKFWRTQSPRHFYGGDWDHNGSCLFTEPLKQQEVCS